MTLNYKKIGKKIKQARCMKKLTQMELADILDMSYSYISYIETGRRHMSLETFVMIANELNVTADFLLSTNIKTKKDALQEQLILFEGCTDYEQRVLFETAKALMEILRKENSMREEQ